MGLDRETLARILNTLPIELSFVNAEGRVAYFSHEDSNKIFPRSRGVIGNRVQDCHPKKSLHMVNQIIDDFKAAKRDVADFWMGVAKLLTHFAPRNRALLAKRDDLQAQIDAWHEARAGKPIDGAAYQAFLRDIGYLVPEPAPFTIGSQNVDPELATMAGPQLVVPVLNARFLLNAANARWGSLYDALYGTDALPGAAAPGGYDAQRGASK